MDCVKSNGKLVIASRVSRRWIIRKTARRGVALTRTWQRLAESLGVKAEFIEINWDNKIMELDSKGVDAVWNGTTLTDEVRLMNCPTRMHPTHRLLLFRPTRLTLPRTSSPSRI
ncbi:MAG: transporter substrate-binding domain-containing protein [Butyricicoccus sp.]